METTKPPLTAQRCQDIVIQSTPDPHQFRPGSDPAVVTLFDLGVVGAIETAVFVAGVKKRLKPWQILDEDIADAPSNTVQQSADSLGQHAF
jgi:hypothetical protein